MQSVNHIPTETNDVPDSVPLNMDEYLNIDLTDNIVPVDSLKHVKILLSMSDPPSQKYEIHSKYEHDQYLNLESINPNVKCSSIHSEIKDCKKTSDNDVISTTPMTHEEKNINYEYVKSILHSLRYSDDSSPEIISLSFDLERALTQNTQETEKSYPVESSKQVSVHDKQKSVEVSKGKDFGDIPDTFKDFPQSIIRKPNGRTVIARPQKKHFELGAKWGLELYKTQMKDYNGVHPHDEDVLLALAISRSLDNIPGTKELFIEELIKGEFENAEKIYGKCLDEVKLIIDSFLDNIPCRISCEYHHDGKQIRWMNSWAKIGWWPNTQNEFSPQLSEGTWNFLDKESDKKINTPDAPAHIRSSEFRCTVWEGLNNKMIHKIISCGNRVNIELNQSKNDTGLYLPVNIGCDTLLNAGYFLDLAFVEVGSLDPLPLHELDIYRVKECTIKNEDGTIYTIYRKSVFGDVMLLEAWPNLFHETFAESDSEEHISGDEYISEEE